MSMMYLVDSDRRKVMVTAAAEAVLPASVRAIDYQTGRMKWMHGWRTGLLTTAGGLCLATARIISAHLMR
jgi:hypothetical protein